MKQLRVLMPHPMLPGVVTMLHATWAGAPPIRRIPVQPINEPEQTFVIELESSNLMGSLKASTNTHAICYCDIDVIFNLIKFRLGQELHRIGDDS